MGKTSISISQKKIHGRFNKYKRFNIASYEGNVNQDQKRGRL
jgi:hypothetical protein